MLPKRLMKIRYIVNSTEEYFGYGKDHMVFEKDFVFLWNKVPFQIRRNAIEDTFGIKIHNPDAIAIFNPFSSYMKIEDKKITQEEFSILFHNIPPKIRKEIIFSNPKRIYKL